MFGRPRIASVLALVIGIACLGCAGRSDLGEPFLRELRGARVPSALWIPDESVQADSTPSETRALSVVLRGMDGDAVVWSKTPGEVYWHGLHATLSEHARRLPNAPVYVIADHRLTWGDLWHVLRSAGAPGSDSVEVSLSRDRPTGFGNEVVLITGGWASTEGISGIGLRSWLYPHRRIRLPRPRWEVSWHDSPVARLAGLQRLNGSGDDRMLSMLWAGTSAPVPEQEPREDGSAREADFAFHDLLVPAFSPE